MAATEAEVYAALVKTIKAERRKRTHNTIGCTEEILARWAELNAPPEPEKTKLSPSKVVAPVVKATGARLVRIKKTGGKG